MFNLSFKDLFFLLFIALIIGVLAVIGFAFSKKIDGTPKEDKGTLITNTGIFECGHLNIKAVAPVSTFRFFEKNFETHLTKEWVSDIYPRYGVFCVSPKTTLNSDEINNFLQKEKDAFIINLKPKSISDSVLNNNIVDSIVVAENNVEYILMRAVNAGDSLVIAFMASKNSIDLKSLFFKEFADSLVVAER